MLNEKKLIDLLTDVIGKTIFNNSKDPKKYNKMIRNIIAWGVKNKKNLSYAKLIEEMKYLVSMIIDIGKGKYKASKEMYIYLLFTVLYVVSPIDIISDFIPIVGLMDDVYFITAFLNSFNKEFTDYKKYLSERKVDFSTFEYDDINEVPFLIEYEDLKEEIFIITRDVINEENKQVIIFEEKYNDDFNKDVNINDFLCNSKTKTEDVLYLINNFFIKEKGDAVTISVNDVLSNTLSPKSFDRELVINILNNLDKYFKTNDNFINPDVISKGFKKNKIGNDLIYTFDINNENYLMDLISLEDKFKLESTPEIIKGKEYDVYVMKYLYNTKEFINRDLYDLINIIKVISELYKDDSVWNYEFKINDTFREMIFYVVKGKKVKIHISSSKIQDYYFCRELEKIIEKEIK